MVHDIFIAHFICTITFHWPKFQPCGSLPKSLCLYLGVPLKGLEIPFGLIKGRFRAKMVIGTIWLFLEIGIITVIVGYVVFKSLLFEVFTARKQKKMRSSGWCMYRAQRQGF